MKQWTARFLKVVPVRDGLQKVNESPQPAPEKGNQRDAPASNQTRLVTLKQLQIFLITAKRKLVVNLADWRIRSKQETWFYQRRGQHQGQEKKN